MPVEYQDSTTFSKAVALLVARQAGKAGGFGRRKVTAGTTEAS
jgi:hypothetical protein